MQRTPVTSSNLISVGYNPATATLEIEFKAGTVYQYDGVPQNVFESLMQASSHGSYFAAHIRDRYSTTKL